MLMLEKYATYISISILKEKIFTSTAMPLQNAVLSDQTSRARLTPHRQMYDIQTEVCVYIAASIDGVDSFNRPVLHSFVTPTVKTHTYYTYSP